jgi:hypothetical protein
MRRYWLAATVSMILAVLFASTVQAKGIPLKGEVVAITKPISNTTGNCACNANWYTFAVSPGKLSITATLQGYSLPFTTSYGLRLFLFAGKRPDGAGQASCLTSQKHCHAQAVIRSNVRNLTVFYLEVYGPGASTVNYSLRFSARFRQLRCASTCSVK